MDKVLKTNLIWTIAVLGVLLIGVATVRMPASQRLVDLVSFSSTVASLILAIFAIFQASLSARDGNQASAAAQVLNTKTLSIVERLDGVLPAMKDDLGVIKDRFSFQPVNHPSTGTGSPEGAGAGSPPKSDKQGAAASQPEVVFDTSGLSPAGYMSMQLIVETLRTGKAMVMDLLDPAYRQYALGYIEGLSAAGQLEYEFKPLTVTYLRVLWMSPGLYEAAEAMKLEMADVPANSGVMDQINRIREFLKSRQSQGI